MHYEVYFTEGAATTKDGLQKFIAENPYKEIIIIDEIDKMPIQHQEGLLTMMERGEFTSKNIIWSAERIMNRNIINYLRKPRHD
jgi:DNA-binding NtrC family response regulator